MDFSDASEWRDFLAWTQGRHSSEIGRPLLQRRGRLVDPEHDARLFAVEDLLAISPERCFAPDVGRSASSSSSAAARAVGGQDVTTRALPARALPLQLAPSPERQVPRICVAAEPAAGALASDGAAPADDCNVGSSTCGKRRSRTSSGVDAANKSASEQRGCIAGDGRSAEGKRGEDQDSAPHSSLFRRRPPEAYARLESVESALTARVRQQVTYEEGGTKGETPMLVAALPAGLLSLGRGQGSKQVEVRVHLPPYVGRDSTIVVTVPMRTLVSELRDEALRMCRAGRRNIDIDVEYELRLYDEDEEEPDYDCPPFDENLQVGCLNVKEVALCAVGKHGTSTPSSPLSSRAGIEGDVLSAPSCVGDNSPGKSRVAAELNADAVEMRAESIQDLPADADLKVEPYDSDRRANSPDLDVGVVEVEDVNDERTVDEATLQVQPAERQVSEDARSGCDGARSSTSSWVGALGSELGNLSGLNRRKADGMAHGFRSVSSAADLAGMVRDTEVSNQRDGLSERDRPFRKASDSEVAGAVPPPLTFSHRRTRSSPLEMRHAGTLITVGGFDSCPAPTPKAKVGEESSSGANASAIAKVAQTQKLELLLDCGGGGEELGGELVCLEVRCEATLCQVLEQLSKERGHRYDPVSLAFERLDEVGVRQRVDLNMQVRHLPACARAPLAVVRKAAAATSAGASRAVTTASLPGSSRQQDAVMRRPPPSVFFFNEYTASIATEYIVSVAAKGSRGPAAECTLVVDRDRLYHRALRARSVERPEGAKRVSFMSPLLRKLGRSLHFMESSSAEPAVLADRRVCDVRSIACDENHQRAFLIAYAPVNSGRQELIYEAQTPTECAEIVARLRFLLTLVNQGEKL